MSNHATDTAGAKARDAALQGALTQIERQFGGAPSCAWATMVPVQESADPDGSAFTRPGTRDRRSS